MTNTQGQVPEARCQACIDRNDGFYGSYASAQPHHVEAMERAWLWMENQADGQSKGGHATFDLMMLREERDALRTAIDATPTHQAADSALEDALDAAFEAVRKRLCAMQRYSFVLDDDGVVRRVQDRTGNWIEFDEAHAMLDPVAVDAAINSDRAARAPADSVLYDPKAVLDVFNSARAGSEKPVGYLRGILAVIAHWESRPYPHHWMVPARADSVPAQVLVAALIAAKQAINSMKAEAETAAQGDEQMMLEACETISNEGLQADIAIRAALASAQQPAPSAAVLDYPHARRFGGCPACGRSDCVAMSCTRTTSDDLLHIAARKQGANHD